MPFLFVLTVVVFVHEMGHYLVGRWCGIGVKAFSIGFGPELVGFNDRHGTRWKLCAIPLGGYVKFVGDMNATSSHADPGRSRRADRRASARLPSTPRPCGSARPRCLPGPLFNFLLTIAVFTVLFAAYGRYVAEPMVAEVTAGSPAAKRPASSRATASSPSTASKVETFADVQRWCRGRAGDASPSYAARRQGRDGDRDARADGAAGRARQQGQGRGDRRRQQRGTRPAAARHLQSGRRVAAAVDETGHIIDRTGHSLQRFAVGREDKCQLAARSRSPDMAGKAAKLGFEWLVQLVALLSVASAS